ncbi:hypothetical protein BGW42_004892 [Actinomortierella wolfii]|nr:hypothetical protein BGW42_004892 [Actinomortierella wolfii]
MAVSIVGIASDYGYNKSEQGLILSAFFFGYIMTQIAGGALADRFGGKPVLSVGAASWTLLTLLTPLAARGGLVWLVALRVCLGLAEGLAFPSIHSMLGRWIPSCERSKYVALVTACSYMGAVIALPTSSALVASSWRWPSVFYLFGVIGVVWSIVWQIWGASTPQECRGIPAEELEWIEHQQQLDNLEGADKKSNPKSDLYTRAKNKLRHRRHHPHHTPHQQQQPNGATEVEAMDLERGATDNTPRGIVVSPTGNTLVNSSSSTGFGQSDQAIAQADDADSRRSSTSSSSSNEDEMEDQHDNMDTKRRNIFCYPQTWSIIISQFCSAWGFFIMQSWLPQYYLDSFGVDVSKIGYYSVVPSVIQGVSGVTVGYFGDRAITDWNWSSIKVRRIAQSVGALGIGVFLLISGKCAKTAWQAMTLISIGMALNGFTMIGATAYQHDICPQRAGLLFALGNTAATIPGIVGVALVGLILDNHSDNRWDLIWTGAFTFYCLGTLSFLALSSPKRIPV